MTNCVRYVCLLALIGTSAVTLMGCGSTATDFLAGELAAVGADQAAQRAPGERRLAVTHAFTLRLPSSDVETIQQKHLAECARLGGTVLNTRLDRSNQGRINARSSVRLTPDAYVAFAKIIATPPARIVVHSESAEDKTAPMLDIDKRLEVKSTLRDRLTAMLHDPGTKSVADLAAIEKELAQVQGDIEAATAQRDYLRTITETVHVDVNYNGVPTLVGGMDLSPIRYAVTGAGQTVVASFAALISFLAAAVPWLPLIAVVFWGVRSGLRRLKARRSPA